MNCSPRGGGLAQARVLPRSSALSQYRPSNHLRTSDASEITCSISVTDPLVCSDRGFVVDHVGFSADQECTSVYFGQKQVIFQQSVVTFARDTSHVRVYFAATSGGLC